jgi:peptide/nickel transport system permease protein
VLAAIGRRAVILAATLVVASLVGFLLQHLIPGNPAVSILGPSATPQSVRALTHKLGLDKPLGLQYLLWLGRFVRGDWGVAYSNNTPVRTLIAQNYPTTLELAVASQVLALLLSVAMAIPAALGRIPWFEKVATTVSFAFFSFPAFVVAPLLTLAFAVHLGWFPASGYVPLTQDLIGNLKSMALPVTTLTLATFPPYYQILKAELANTLRQNYIELARAKGLTTARVLFVHAMKPSTLTLATAAGLQVAGLLTGAFIVEYIFALPGLGKLTVNSIQSSDYLVVQAIVVITVAVVAVVNFLIDMLYLFLDPRTRR